MKGTFEQFRLYLLNMGIELALDEDMFESATEKFWMPPKGYIITVNGRAIQRGVEFFTEGCDEIYEANTIRCIFDIDAEALISFPISSEKEWALYKKVV